MVKMSADVKFSFRKHYFNDVWVPPYMPNIPIGEGWEMSTQWRSRCNLIIKTYGGPHQTPTESIELTVDASRSLYGVPAFWGATA